MVRHTPPIGDIDLATGRNAYDEDAPGAVSGPRDSSATEIGKLGGLGDTSDGADTYRETGEPVEIETGGLTDSMAAVSLGDVVSDYSTADADGSALDGPAEEEDDLDDIDDEDDDFDDEDEDARRDGGENERPL